MLELRALGRSDLKVSSLCLGSNQFGTALDQGKVDALLDRFDALGGNFIDTARGYGDWIPQAPVGASERAIGAWLKTKQREKYVIATKGGMMDLRAGDWAPRVTPRHLAQDLSQSLNHLGLDRIDLYWVHVDDPSQSVEAIVDALIEHRRAGRIRHFGLSNWGPDRVRAARAYAAKIGDEGPVAIQPFWGFAVPNVEAAQQQGYGQYFEDGFQPLLAEGLPVVPYGSQSRGFFAKLESEGEEGMREDVKAMFLNDTNRNRFNAIRRLAAKRGVTTNVAALAYLTSQANVFPIIGASTPEQLSESVAAAELRLSSSELAQLQAAA